MNDISQEDEIIVEAEEWKPSKYYSIGKYFTINGELYKTVKSNASCYYCDFDTHINSDLCGKSVCSSEGREDNNNVIFVLYDTLEEE